MQDGGANVISIQIPEGAEPGDELIFQINDQELSIPVPVGCRKGDVLQIKYRQLGHPQQQ